MKKAILISMILLSMLALTIVPAIVPMTRSATILPNLKYTATPIQEQFVETADFSNPSDPVGTYVPYDVDIVNGELYPNGGAGIYVAIIDTGLVSNWNLFLPPTANVRTDLGRGWSYDVAWDSGINNFVFTPNTARGFITKAYEGDGHGTHVASSIVGYQRSTVGVAPHIVEGVAPKATIIPLLGLDTWLVNCPDPTYPGYHAGKVLFRGGDDWMLTSAIYYVASLAETNGWKIICTNSWGSSEPSPAIQTAIDYAIGKGVIFTFAAGNGGDAGMDWPGAYPEVISCAAGGWTMQMIGTGTPNIGGRWYLTDVPEKLNTQDALGNNWQMFLTTFSGRPNAALGQSWKDLDVCAPGSYVVGPYKPEAAWTGTAWANLNAATNYYGLWGTSMATPHVAGVAAIVASLYPNLNQADMEWILQKAATRVPLSSNTKYAYDPYYDPNYPSAPGPFNSQQHDFGRGWLTADEAVKTASVYHK